MSLQQAALQALEALEEQVRRIGPEFDDPFAYGLETDRWALMRKAIAALHEALPQPEQREPLAWFRLDEKTNEAFLVYFPSADGKDWRPLYAMPRKPLTPREIELLDGMIEVQLHHAAQCDRIANRTMAEKQKGWDMERVALLRKLKAAHGIGEPK